MSKRIPDDVAARYVSGEWSVADVARALGVTKLEACYVMDAEGVYRKSSCLTPERRDQLLAQLESRRGTLTPVTDEGAWHSLRLSAARPEEGTRK